MPPTNRVINAFTGPSWLFIVNRGVDAYKERAQQSSDKKTGGFRFPFFSTLKRRMLPMREDSKIYGRSRSGDPGGRQSEIITIESIARRFASRKHADPFAFRPSFRGPPLTEPWNR